MDDLICGSGVHAAAVNLFSARMDKGTVGCNFIIRPDFLYITFRTDPIAYCMGNAKRCQQNSKAGR